MTNYDNDADTPDFDNNIGDNTDSDKIKVYLGETAKTFDIW